MLRKIIQFCLDHDIDIYIKIVIGAILFILVFCTALESMFPAIEGTQFMWFTIFCISLSVAFHYFMWCIKDLE